MKRKQKFLMELDRLKTIHRNAFVSDGSRHENSAEHSWHTALALLVMCDTIPFDFDVNHAIRIALVHDICEIGAGDMSIYDPNRASKVAEEEAYLNSLADEHQGFALEIRQLWSEYEQQQTPEARAVKVMDRLLPFLLNLATQGATWKKLGISRTQAIKVNSVVSRESPEIYEWMEAEIERAVELGWLSPK